MCADVLKKLMFQHVFGIGLLPDDLDTFLNVIFHYLWGRRLFERCFKRPLLQDVFEEINFVDVLHIFSMAIFSAFVGERPVSTSLGFRV